MTYFRFVLGMLTLLTGVAIAQEIPPLEQMMELNRSGKWEQAAQLAQRFVDAKPEKSTDERCQGYYSLIYSQTRLGQIKQAKSTGSPPRSPNSVKNLVPENRQRQLRMMGSGTLLIRHRSG